MRNGTRGALQFGIVGVAVGLGAWRWVGGQNLPTQEPIRKVSIASSIREPSALVATTAPAPKVVRNVVPKPRALAKETVFLFDKELDQYSELKRRIFLTETDRASKKILFSNSRFIDGVAESLRRPGTMDLSTVARQGAAIDFLLEALNTEEGRGAAEAALRDIVLDSHVESEGLEAKARESLAGVKGEVLYKWAAAEPQRTSEFEAWLPGPISRKIWANVLETQDRNVKESIVVGASDQ